MLFFFIIVKKIEKTNVFNLYISRMKFIYDKNNEKFVVKEASRIELHQMNIWMTRHVKNYKYMPLVKRGIWDGTKSYFTDDSFNLGLWKEAIRGCKEIGVPFHVENKEDFPLNKEVTLEKVREFIDEFFKTHKVINKNKEWIDFKPYEHQIETAYKILKNRYCMAEVATSGGKSLIISIIIFYTLKHINPDAKFLIIVPSITLVSQFYDDLIEYNYGLNNLYEMRKKDSETILNKKHNPFDIRIEEIMSDKPRKHSGKKNANIYIGTFQSLEKWPDKFFKKIHTVITDEAHRAKANTITKILTKTFTHAYSRVGVSGTFPSEDSCEILTIQSILGPKITEISASQLKEKGIISKMEVKCVLMNHDNPELNERIKSIRKGGYGKEALDLEKRYIHSSKERMNFINKIINKINKNTLVLFHSIDYGTELYETLRKNNKDKEFYYIDGEVKGKERSRIKDEMEKTNDKIKILVASFGTLSTGVSIRAIFNIIFVDSFKSEQIIIQSIGRALRLHEEKKKAIIFDLVDVFDTKNFNNVLYTHFKERLKYYNKREYPYSVKKLNL